MIHDLKILPQYFKEVVSGEKKFEIRKDDRNFSVGDIIDLREFDNNHYTGNIYSVKITYKFDGGSYGIEDGYCVLSIEPIQNGAINDPQDPPMVYYSSSNWTSISTKPEVKRGLHSKMGIYENYMNDF